jgi:hypothetical protein
MKIHLVTPVRLEFREVFQRFDEKLFWALKPPLLPLTVTRFDGCSVGDEVHLDLGWSLWISLIVAEGQEDDRCFFVDEGRKLPFPVVYWRHQHIVQRDGSSSLIIDDIEFKTYFRWLDVLVFPTLWLMFRLRKSIYQKFFGVPV